jgi:hypothetical protein
MPIYTVGERVESAADLRAALEKAERTPEGKPIIYTILRSVSASGMTRYISAYVIIGGKPHSLSWDFARAQGKRCEVKHGQWANKVSGIGMDMGFAYALDIAHRADWGEVGFSHQWL